MSDFEPPELYPGYMEWMGVRFPYVDTKMLHTAAPLDVPEFGFHASLPCENGAVLDFTYDPGLNQETGKLENIEEGDATSVWAYAIHPETRARISASVFFGELRYAYNCGGVDVKDEAACGGYCEHDNGAWFESVKTPQEIQKHWAYIGSLQVLPHAGSKRAS